ncbi:MAG TPA: ATP-binding protein, partial [Candidatus Rifleibacterium sp.]|nr:ATP-binding protein [Candidatus Rifleibacterium sp.]
SDQGPGIPEDELQRVFSPFYCLSEDRNPQKGGIGLGLAIAERAIRLHNGQITLSNRTEGGLTATISLPTDS